MRLKDKHFSHISARTDAASRILKETQVLQGNPTNVHLQCEVFRLRKEAMFHSEVERSFYYQRLSVLIMKIMISVLSFFHLVVKRNNERNYIATVLERDGTYTSSKRKWWMNSCTFLMTCWEKVTLSDLLRLRL